MAVYHHRHNQLVLLNREKEVEQPKNRPLSRQEASVLLALVNYDEQQVKFDCRKPVSPPLTDVISLTNFKALLHKRTCYDFSTALIECASLTNAILFPMSWFEAHWLISSLSWTLNVKKLS
ncbi:unnamed protein product [Leuciscus chuanchicus]